MKPINPRQFADGRVEMALRFPHIQSNHMLWNEQRDEAIWDVQQLAEQISREAWRLGKINHPDVTLERIKRQLENVRDMVMMKVT